jgi:hypothetical protein
MLKVFMEPCPRHGSSRRVASPQAMFTALGVSRPCASAPRKALPHPKRCSQLSAANSVKPSFLAGVTAAFRDLSMGWCRVLLLGAEPEVRRYLVEGEDDDSMLHRQVGDKTREKEADVGSKGLVGQPEQAPRDSREQGPQAPRKKGWKVHGAIMRSRSISLVAVGKFSESQLTPTQRNAS